MFSLIVPVYKNEESILPLLEALERMYHELDQKLRVTFVVDGSPDRSFALLNQHLGRHAFPSQLVALSRNFGSLAAIRVGLEHSEGTYFAIMAADLQEPPDLLPEIFRTLEKGASDVVIATREFRSDPLLTRISSALFWALYRRLVQPEMPAGGVDVFGCTDRVRRQLIQLNESNSSLIGLIIWMGFRRAHVPYSRQKRIHGKSAWTFSKKLNYLFDSVFSFSNLPIRALTSIGIVGLSLSVLLVIFVVIGKMLGRIPVPGYTTTLAVISFFAGLNCLGLGIIGTYVWRAFENTKARPIGIVMNKMDLADVQRSET